jgi:hypothetical protein
LPRGHPREWTQARYQRRDVAANRSCQNTSAVKAFGLLFAGVGIAIGVRLIWAYFGAEDLGVLEAGTRVYVVVGGVAAIWVAASTIYHAFGSLLNVPGDDFDKD